MPGENWPSARRLIAREWLILLACGALAVLLTVAEVVGRVELAEGGLNYDMGEPTVSEPDLGELEETRRPLEEYFAETGERPSEPEERPDRISRVLDKLDEEKARRAGTGPPRGETVGAVEPSPLAGRYTHTLLPEASSASRTLLQDVPAAELLALFTASLYLLSVLLRSTRSAIRVMREAPPA